MIPDRIFNIEMSLIGKWQNETIGLMFDGNIDGKDYGTVIIGDPTLTLHAISKYQVFIQDNNPFLRLINDKQGETQIKEWEIAEIDRATGILRFRPKDAKEIILHK